MSYKLLALSVFTVGINWNFMVVTSCFVSVRKHKYGIIWFVFTCVCSRELKAVYMYYKSHSSSSKAEALKIFLAKTPCFQPKPSLNMSNQIKATKRKTKERKKENKFWKKKKQKKNKQKKTTTKKTPQKTNKQK